MGKLATVAVPISDNSGSATDEGWDAKRSGGTTARCAGVGKMNPGLLVSTLEGIDSSPICHGMEQRGIM